VTRVAQADTLDDLTARLAASETNRVALAAQLETTRRELWTERALRRYPAIESAVDLIPHVQDEESFMAFAARLSGYATQTPGPSAR
jgi:hypothetical protein